MLNRRYLRIKVMQALYGYFQSDEKDLGKGEKEMFNSIDKIYDLYIYLISVIIELRDVAENISEDAKTKRLPTKEDLNPNKKFIDNQLIKQLSENISLKREMTQRKITWQTEGELIKKIFLAVKNSEEYSKYMSSEVASYEADRDFIAEAFKHCIADFELLNHFFEEKSIHWIDDIRLVHSMVVKTITSFKENSEPTFSLMPLYKDAEDDKQFVKDLYRKTALQDKETEKLIAEKTKNWEVDRIAMMDVLLMKMAIAEILDFSSIPVKVTLNEYIEISKLYSTPKSKIFINGILDKLVVDFKSQNKLAKTGRGLME